MKTKLIGFFKEMFKNLENDYKLVKQLITVPYVLGAKTVLYI
jgi:hypothetical protein